MMTCAHVKTEGNDSLDCWVLQLPEHNGKPTWHLLRAAACISSDGASFAFAGETPHQKLMRM